jgi:DHA2 family multidrug resistance protein
MLSALQKMFMSKGADMVTAAHQAHEMVFRMVERQAGMLAYNTVFRLLGGLFLLMIPFIFLMRRPESKGGPVAMH